MEDRNNEVLIAHHPNAQTGQTSCMSVDASHQLAMLGTRRCLTLIDLKQPNRVIKRVNLMNKWDVGSVLWNPTKANQKYFLTTYNQWTDVWEYEQATCKRLSTLQAHTRAISDVDWSMTDPNIMATCSLDAHIYVWDIRDTKRFKLSTSTVVGASQVKWNPTNPYCFASAHDGNIRIWDSRNCKTAVQCITAHLSKIFSLDWSRSEEHLLASSSQDSTIRFWDTNQEPRSATAIINVDKPVWKGQFTPFGKGMLSISFVNYQETPITLWSLETNQPVQNYTGHTNLVMNAQWRKCNEEGWQLVTWSRDQTLRLWPMTSANLLENDSDESRLSSNPSEFNLPSTTLPNLDLELPDSSLASGMILQQSMEDDEGSTSPSSTPTKVMNPLTDSSTSLENEFKMLSARLQHLRMKHLDILGRTCLISLRTTTHHADLHINFPDRYPNQETPVFQIIKPNNIDKDEITSLQNSLHENAHEYVKHGKMCLEPCLRQLITQLSQISYMPDAGPEDSSLNFPSHTTPFLPRSRTFSVLSDLKQIPFPRTTGARFNQSGLLVVFLRPYHIKGYQSVYEKTPRSCMGIFHHRNSAPVLSVTGFPRHIPSSLSQLTPMYPARPDLSVFPIYYREKRPSRKSLKFLYNPTVATSAKESDLPSSGDMKQVRQQQAAGRIAIVDVTSILPVSKMLAKQYLIPTGANYKEACRRNMNSAATEEMTDLVQLWSYLSVLGTSSASDTSDAFNEFTEPSFAEHPLGEELLYKVFKHYEKLHDIQTLAMLACTFGSKCPNNTEKDTTQRKPDEVKSLSYHNYVDEPEISRLRKSASETTFSELPAFIKSMAGSPPTESAFSSPLSPRSRGSPQDDYRFIEQNQPDPEPTVRDEWVQKSRKLCPELQSKCNDYISSHAELLQAWKMHTKRAEICKHIHRKSEVTPHHAVQEKQSCSVCQLPLTKAIGRCSECGHGMHLEHLVTWFKSRRDCPLCNCACVAFIND